MRSKISRKIFGENVKVNSEHVITVKRYGAS
jgi:hypothetical protein